MTDKDQPIDNKASEKPTPDPVKGSQETSEAKPAPNIESENTSEQAAAKPAKQPTSAPVNPADEKSTNKTSTEKTTISKTPPAKKTSTAKPKTPTPSKKTGRLVIILCVLLVVVLCASGLGGYWGWQLWQTQNARVGELEAVFQEKGRDFSAQTQQQATGLQKQSQALLQLSQDVDRHQKSLEQRLNAQAIRLSQLSGDNRDAWMLEEARYLLRLANQRQLTGGGVAGIIGLLESADKLLLALDKPDVFPLRESLRKDILRLKIAPQIDREGIYLELSALISQVDELPLVPLEASFEKPAGEKATPSEPLEWDEGIWASIQKALGNLDQYIRIKHHDEPLQVLVSDAQQQLVAQNLRLLFEQAQVALLREEDIIYRKSLTQVVYWLNKHYSHFSEKGRLVSAVSELKKKIIISQLPDISASLIQLNQYIQQAENAITPNDIGDDKKETAL